MTTIPLTSATIKIPESRPALTHINQNYSNGPSTVDINDKHMTGQGSHAFDLPQLQ